MDLLDFDLFYLNIRDKIEEIKNSLYESSSISENYVIDYYKDTGKYLEQANNQEENPDKHILINIINSGGVIDSSASVDAYLQLVEIKVLAFEDQRDDVTNILGNLVLLNKNVLVELNNTPANIVISDMADYSGEKEINGQEKFDASLTFKYIVFPNSVFSNSLPFKIDNIVIPYSSASISRKFEVTSDNRKRNTAVFRQQTSGLVIEVQGLFSNIIPLNKLFDDATKASYIGNTYLLKIERNNQDILSNNNSGLSSVLMDVQFKLAFGSIVGYVAHFVPAIVGGV